MQHDRPHHSRPPLLAPGQTYESVTELIASLGVWPPKT